MEIYEYNAYIPKVDENGVITGYDQQTMTVNIPYTAVVKTLAVSDYDAIAEDYEELPIIGGEVLKHTVGEPTTYPTTTAGLKDVNLPDGDYMGVAFGDGFITQSLEIEESTSSGYSNTNAVNVKAGAGPGSVTVGVTAGYENGFGTIKTTTEGKSFTGTIVNMPMEASGYGYNYSWKIMQYTYEGKQTFPVVSYIVADVTQPAPLPSNLEMDVENTTDTSVTLTWDATEKSVAGYQVYRHYNFPEGSGDYPIGDIVSADQFVSTTQKDGKTVYNYSFTDENLNPYTEYEYKIQAISGIAPYESVLSNIPM